VSADLESIERLTAAIVERAEQLRTVEMQRLVAEAELQALEAQIHPHFLFNALNTLYGVIPRESGDARRLVLNLSDILRYFLKTGKTLIPLEEEMRIVRAYLEIEQLRMGGKLAASIEVDPGLEREPIPILSIEPLVENAVKHGVASRSTPGAVRIRVRSTPSGMAVEVGDTGPGFTAARADSQRGAGMGLANVARRLKLCYGEQAELRIDSTADGTRVAFDVPLAPSAEAA
jgi:LytS/YehU family sensor histidine kinase